jgi:hypothetical protein
MSLEQVLLAGLSLGGAVLGWLARELWGAVQQLRKDLQSLEVRISSDYVRYDRLQDAMRPIMDKLQRIEDSLAHKADKP